MYRARLLVLLVLPLMCFCGERTRVTTRFELPSRPDEQPRCPYEWQRADSWPLMAWAVLDSPEDARALAVSAGYASGESPSPGDEIFIALDSHLEDALEARMVAARLLREATEAREEGDRASSFSLLVQAMREDSTWSVPVYDLGIHYLEEGDRGKAVEVLLPMGHKYRIALLLAKIAWDEGRTTDAVRLLETALLDPDPPPEVLAACGIAYTVTGDPYQAASAWRRILADPDAPSDLRLSAIRFALEQQGRERRSLEDSP